MTWKVASIMSEKLAFIAATKSSKETFSKICTNFGIGRSTGYKWLKKHQQKGKEGLVEESRRPHTSPLKTSEEIEDLVLNVRDQHPRWGSVTIKSYLEEKGFWMPSDKTIHRILKKYGRITEEESLKPEEFLRFEHEHPNDLWQMDFKGHFRLTNKQRCHPLTLLDDHSRFSLAILSCANERLLTVKQGLIQVFRRYGLPARMTMDNGAPWGYTRDQKHTRLTVWLMKQGIKVSHSRPYHPQTQGKLERFHRTLKEELLQVYRFDDLYHAQKGFDWFRDMYNYERPHGAIKAYAPGYAYKRSLREYREEVEPFTYDTNVLVRKVNKKGMASYKGRRYFIGEGFGGEYVGIQENEENGLLEVFFCEQKVLKLDPGR